MSRMTTLQLVRNICLAGLAGGTGSIVINTWRRDSNRAKKLLGYSAVAGLCGVGIGYAMAVAKRQSPYHHGLFVGGSYVVLSGTFLVFRDSISTTFGAGGRQLFVDQSEHSTVHILLAREPVPPMFASAVAGGATGLLVSIFLRRGILPTALTSVQGIGMAVMGQYVYDRFRIWRLEKTIAYHYPELTGNAPKQLDTEPAAESTHWSKRLEKVLGGKSYSSRLNDDIRCTEIQLELLEEQERELLTKVEEGENVSRANSDKQHKEREGVTGT